MDTRNGAIFSPDEIAAMEDKEPFADRLKHLREMVLAPTIHQLKQMKVGRNDPCPCGSGMKFKKCCLQK